MKKNNLAGIEEELRETVNACEIKGSDDSDSDQIPATATKRTRRARPIAWTRIIHVTPQTNSQVPEHWIERDIVLQGELREAKQRLTKVAW